MPKLLIFILVLFSTSLYGEDISIDMLNVRSDGQSMVYSIDVARVQAGDTITWFPNHKGHNV